MSIYYRNRINGFSLIELLIVVVIVAILATIVLPSYQDSIRKSRRSDAHAALVKMALEQENYRMLNDAYASVFGQGTNDVKEGVSDYYTFSIDNTAGATYTLKASAPTISSQYDDASCRAITIDQSGHKLPTNCW